MTVTNRNYFQEDIKSSLISGNALCHSVQNLLSLRLLSKNLKSEINKTIILPDVMYGCETRSFILTEEHRLKVFENRVMLRIFGSKRGEVEGEQRRPSNKEDEVGGACNTYVRDEKGSQHFGRKTLREVIKWETRSKREDNTEMNLKGTVCEDLNRVHLTQDTVQWQSFLSMIIDL
jgi:hypothetical protein